MSISPHSYSSLKTLKTCPHQYWHRYVLKDVPFHETVEMKWGNRVHDALEHRLRDKVPLPEDLAAYESFCLPLDRFKPKVELKLGMRMDSNPCDFFARDVFLRGKLDVVIFDGETVALYDWKTGKPFEDPFELQVQALLFKTHHYLNVKEMSGRYVWLKTNSLGRNHALNDTASTWDQVWQLHKRALQYEQSGEWPKTPQVLCGWCNVASCEHNPERADADTRTDGQKAS